MHDKSMSKIWSQNYILLKKMVPLSINCKNEGLKKLIHPPMSIKMPIPFKNAIFSFLISKSPQALSILSKKTYFCILKLRLEKHVQD